MLPNIEADLPEASFGSMYRKMRGVGGGRGDLNLFPLYLRGIKKINCFKFLKRKKIFVGGGGDTNILFFSLYV
jgi:hypothetical protein